MKTNKIFFDPGTTQGRQQRAMDFSRQFNTENETLYRTDIFPFGGSSSDPFGERYKTVFASYYMCNGHYIHNVRLFFCHNDYFPHSVPIYQTAIDMGKYYKKEELFETTANVLDNIIDNFNKR